MEEKEWDEVEDKVQPEEVYPSLEEMMGDALKAEQALYLAHARTEQHYLDAKYGII